MLVTGLYILFYIVGVVFNTWQYCIDFDEISLGVFLLMLLTAIAGPVVGILAMIDRRIRSQKPIILWKRKQ